MFDTATALVANVPVAPENSCWCDVRLASVSDALVANGLVRVDVTVFMQRGSSRDERFRASEQWPGTPTHRISFCGWTQPNTPHATWIATLAAGIVSATT